MNIVMSGAQISKHYECADSHRPSMQGSMLLQAQKRLSGASSRCEPHSVVLDFHNSTLKHSNLGCLGPDTGACNIRYAHVGNVNGRPFDLVVTAGKSYQNHRASRNGLAGKFGIVNLKVGTAADFNFCFEDAASGQPVVLNSFHFSMFDLDEGFKTKERMYVQGFERFTLSEHSEVAVQKLDDGRTLFESTSFGRGCDNPKDPLQLDKNVTCKGASVDIRRRAVTFLFANASQFSVKLELKCHSKCGNSGRNFLFAGSSSLDRSCDETTTTTTAATTTTASTLTKTTTTTTAATSTTSTLTTLELDESCVLHEPSLPAIDIDAFYNTTLQLVQAFGNVKSVSGDLRVQHSSITPLTGLNKLTCIGGRLLIEQNNQLKILSGLDNLDNVGAAIKISSNPSLMSVEGLNGLTHLRSLEISNNSVLGHLVGLSGIEHIAEDFNLVGNGNLAGVFGLERLQSVGGDLEISGNTQLQNLAGLGRLESVGGHLRIFDNQLDCETIVRPFCARFGGCQVSDCEGQEGSVAE